MRLIVHIGMPKAGSSTLQRGLTLLRPALLEQGCLYPEPMVSGPDHGFLATAVRGPQTMPRIYRQRFAKRMDTMPAKVAAWVDTVGRTARRQKVHTVILSTETLFRMTDPEEFARLGALLGRISDDVEIVAYVRKPSDFYPSSVQQRLKASQNIAPLQPIAYRRYLEAFQAHLTDRVRVFDFARAREDEAGPLGHFLGVCCPGAIAPADIPRAAANVSLSAESTAILQEYRRLHHAQANNRFSKDTGRIIQALLEADRRLGTNTRPKLDPEIADQLDHGSPDVLWLRDTFGIVFDGIDYGREGPTTFRRTPARTAGLFETDPRKQTRTLFTVLNILATHEDDPHPGAGRIDPEGGAVRQGRPGPRGRSRPKMSEKGPLA